MAANKAIRLGPISMAAAAANLFNPPVISGGVNPPGTSTNTYYLLKKISIVNRSASQATFALFIGATGASAAGTEFGGSSKVIAANDRMDFPLGSGTRLDVADFLTGFCATGANILTIEAEGEMGVT